MAGTLVITTLSDGTNSTSATNPIMGSAKAWVNFNGTGTVAIRASYNVSSITDNGTGDYTINFTNAFADTSYSVVCTGATAASDLRGAFPNFTTAPATSSCQIVTMNTTGTTKYDTDYVRAAFFR
jgi:hypothetical protein